MIEQQERKKNKWKVYAVYLAHQIEDELRILHEDLEEWKEQEIKENGERLQKEMIEQGLASQIGIIMYYAEQYRKIPFNEYHKWIHS
jgi:hypothetical protein